MKYTVKVIHPDNGDTIITVYETAKSEAEALELAKEYVLGKTKPEYKDFMHTCKFTLIAEPSIAISINGQIEAVI